MTKINAPPHAPTRAAFSGRRRNAPPDADIHDITMQRPAEPLYLAQHHLNSGHDTAPAKDEA